VTKQWTTKWPQIANVFFRIVQNSGEKVTSPDFRGGDRPKHLVLLGSDPGMNDACRRVQLILLYFLLFARLYNLNEILFG